MTFSPGTRGFYAFAAAMGIDLEPFQRRIARAVLGPAREAVIVLPRGNAKSTVAALLAVHHCLTTDRPSVYVGAGSREQARVIGRMIERFARHPAVADLLTIRHDELRIPGSGTVLQVVASDGGRAHGWERPTFLIGDEAWNWSDRDPTLLGAMQTALIKNPTAKLMLISTSASSLDTPLGKLRARALNHPHKRDGAVLEARSADGSFVWLEWSVPSTEDLDDPAMVKAANPASWISEAELIAQRERVTDVEFAQFHASVFGVRQSAWLPPGAWDACAGEWADPTEPVFLGVDIGGTRSASAVVGVTADFKVAEVYIEQGQAAVLRITDKIIEIAARRPVSEVAFDPQRYISDPLRLQRDHGIPVTEFPQFSSFMVPASENLHRVIVEGKLTHPGHPELTRHVNAAIALPTDRGWKLSKRSNAEQIDGAIGLAMACARAEAAPKRVRVLAVG